MKRIGIYAGTFDPLHIGHISFALETVRAAHLDKVYLLPEDHPRLKPHASPLEVRVKSIADVITQYGKLELLSLPDPQFTVEVTLPELQRRLPDSQLVLLVGADVIIHMPTWPQIDQLMKVCELAIGMRDGYEITDINNVLASLSVQPKQIYFVETSHAAISSTLLRSID